ncbi:AraC family transcriptional regulator [uncultured Tateyamaria sp.]|uniref:helix-turn-helix transcriptional regulator n=1 Tax=Tateyamaria sp. 1078 TaxID=3417464 RepID=UPI00261E49CB|nr:AraC family transcriptional regulator [uncultured Tateyamaria sp.]
MALPPVQITTLAQMTGPQEWRLALAHERAEHLIIWITRGQGRLLMNGTRRGVGTHNAIVIPARTLFSLELGRQGMGQVALVPEGTDVRLPQTPRQLRLRDVAAINEINSLFEAAQREATQARPLAQDALDAHVALISVWVRRQIAMPDHLPVQMDAAARLTAAFCEGIVENYAQPMTMADHARALGVTPTHLSRACKASTGRTAAEVLTERTLYAARISLIESKVPIQDIARHLGFGSAAYFTRFIQQHTGKTPTALRQAATSAPGPARTG